MKGSVAVVFPQVDEIGTVFDKLLHCPGGGGGTKNQPITLEPNIHVSYNKKTVRERKRDREIERQKERQNETERERQRERQ